MKAFFRKVLCCALVVCFCCLTGVPALASGNASNAVNQVQPIQGGYMYTQLTDSQSIVILTDTLRGMAEVDICLLSQRNTVYHWILEDNLPSGIGSPTDAFWNSLISYCNSHMSEATVFQFIDYTLDEPMVLPQTRSSAAADLQQDLAGLVGSQYSNRQMYTSSTTGQRITIYEDMVFRISYLGYKAWSTAISIGSIIATVLGLTATTALVKAIANIYSVAASVGSIIPPGKLNKYQAQAIVSRLATVNGSKYVYNTAEKFYNYRGYEDGDINSTARAYVDSSSQSIDYPQGSSYFNSYQSQAADAYAMFQRIGQKP